MKVTLLQKNPLVYTGNVWYVQGNMKGLNDLNTLIDVGTNDFIIEELEAIYPGTAKKRVEQVFLTHSHFDHAGALLKIKELYNPAVYAYSDIEGVDYKLRDGMTVRIADQEATVIHITEHSHDSLCYFCKTDRVLFSGDTPLKITKPGGTYHISFLESLQRLIALDIKIIYGGHDQIYTENVQELLENTWLNVKKSSIFK